MIVWGTLVTQPAPAAPDMPTWRARALATVGVFLALYVFMADSLRAVRQGLDITEFGLPTWFNWPLFCVALALMALPIVETGRRRQSTSTV
jgi:hypothetical protein